jgi:hypothetical protein
VGFQVNGTHQLLSIAVDVTLLGKNISLIKENTEAVLGASKKVSPDINAEKTKYMPCLITRL